MPSSVIIRGQMNSFRIGHAQHQASSEKVVRECKSDLVITRFQRHREGAILPRTLAVGKLSRFVGGPIFPRLRGAGNPACSRLSATPSKKYCDPMGWV
jgi:hypothetical protein